MKKFILIILLIVLFAMMALQTSTIHVHKSEINRLRQRVHNLEIVVNYAENKTDSPPKQSDSII